MTGPRVCRRRCTHASCVSGSAFASSATADIYFSPASQYLGKFHVLSQVHAEQRPLGGYQKCIFLADTEHLPLGLALILWTGGLFAIKSAVCSQFVVSFAFYGWLH